MMHLDKKETLPLDVLFDFDKYKRFYIESKGLEKVKDVKYKLKKTKNKKVITFDMELSHSTNKYNYSMNMMIHYYEYLCDEYVGEAKYKDDYIFLIYLIYKVLCNTANIITYNYIKEIDLNLCSNIFLMKESGYSCYCGLLPEDVKFGKNYKYMGKPLDYIHNRLGELMDKKDDNKVINGGNNKVIKGGNNKVINGGKKDTVDEKEKMKKKNYLSFYLNKMVHPAALNVSLVSFFKNENNKYITMMGNTVKTNMKYEYIYDVLHFKDDDYKYTCVVLSDNPYFDTEFFSRVIKRRGESLKDIKTSKECDYLYLPLIYKFNDEKLNEIKDKYKHKNLLFYTARDDYNPLLYIKSITQTNDKHINIIREDSLLGGTFQRVLPEYIEMGIKSSESSIFDAYIFVKPSTQVIHILSNLSNKYNSRFFILLENGIRIPKVNPGKVEIIQGDEQQITENLDILKKKYKKCDIIENDNKIIREILHRNIELASPDELIDDPLNIWVYENTLLTYILSDIFETSTIHFLTSNNTKLSIDKLKNIKIHNIKADKFSSERAKNLYSLSLAEMNYIIKNCVDGDYLWYDK